jgi:NAD+ synthase (glutamine-hydrolysing)
LNIERSMNNSFSGTKVDKNVTFVNIPDGSAVQDELKRDYSPSPFVPKDQKERAKTCETIFSIQTHGLARRMRHINSNSLTIGVSGGLDSTLAFMVCVRTMDLLGYDRKNINAISMPGFGTTRRTKSNAEKLSSLLGVSFREISINASVEQHFKDIGHDQKNKDVVYENAQARERTQILMDIANQTGGIVIGTGDLSELALGWCTYNADQMSMYGVNASVPKTLVSYIIKWLADEVYEGEASKVLKDIAITPISPELLPPDEEGEITQKTEDRIGPYILHDFFLYYAIRCHFSPEKVYFLAQQAFKKTYTKKIILKWLKVFYSRFFSQQFKRSCMPDGIKVGTISLSPRGDWRMPSDASAAIWLEELESL